MKVTCQECGTSFNLDDQHIKPEGTKVRCSKCSSVFTVTPPEPEAPADAEPQFEETVDISDMDGFDFELEEDEAKADEGAAAEEENWEETLDISQLDDLDLDLESDDDTADAGDQAADELDFSDLEMTLDDEAPAAGGAEPSDQESVVDDLSLDGLDDEFEDTVSVSSLEETEEIEISDLLEDFDDAEPDSSILESTAEFEDLPDVKDVLKEEESGVALDEEELTDFSLEEDDLDLGEAPEEIAMLEETAELVDLPDADSITDMGASADGLDVADLENILEDDEFGGDVADREEEELELDFELDDEDDTEAADDAAAEESGEFDLSDLDLDLDADAPEEEPESEELDLGDLDLSLDETDEDVAVAGDSAEDEDLDFSDLELELDADDAEESFDAAADESEELDFGDLGLDLEDDEESVDLGAADGDELDFSDLEGMVESEDADLDVDLEISEPDAGDDDLDISGEMELDFGETPEISAEDEITLQDFSMSIGEEETVAAPDLEEETVMMEAPEEIDVEEETQAAPPMTDYGATMEMDTSVAVAEMEEPELPPEKAKPKRKAGKFKWILLILVLIGGGGAGAVYFMADAGIEIPFVSDYFAPPVVDTAGNLLILPIDSAIDGKYMTNSKIGNIFVIKGRVRNGYDHPRSNIRIEGKIFAKGKSYKKSQTVFCGNQLSAKDLETLDFKTIQKRLGNKAGTKSNNLNVPPGKVLPFMVVFPGVPGDLEEFTIEVAGSRKGQ